MVVSKHLTIHSNSLWNIFERTEFETRIAIVVAFVVLELSCATFLQWLSSMSRMILFFSFGMLEITSLYMLGSTESSESVVCMSTNPSGNISK